MKLRLISVIAMSAMIPTGCTDRIETVRAFTPEAQKIQDAPVSQSIDVRVAFADECSNGGIIYTSYIDVNLNSAFDSDDTVIKKYPICNGTNGSNGQNGNGVAFTVVPASVAVCANGGATVLMASDVGNTGIYDINATNQQSMTICNGQNATTPDYTPVEPIIACGNNVANKEVLLRLQNGQVLGSFSDDVGGTMTRLSFLPDGNYMNTDNSGCTFSLSTSPDGKTRSVSWSGVVQKTWSMIR